MNKIKKTKLYETDEMCVHTIIIFSNKKQINVSY